MREQRRRLLLAGAAMAAFAPARSQSAAANIAPLEDLPAVLREVARTRAPLLVLFSTPGCPFCQEVRQNYLLPRVAEERARATARLILREVDITAAATLLDVDGQSSTQAAFAARFGIKFVPVVMLFDAQLHTLAEPLIGIDRAGFYESYLQDAIGEAQRRLRS